MTRTFKHQIKRIVEYEGSRRTYNTEIATEVAGFANMALFKTRTHGYYFLVSPKPEIRATLRSPSELKLQIEAAAKNSRLSVNAWVVRCLEDKVSQKELGE